MFVVMYDLRAMPAGHQTFLRQRTFSVPVRRDTTNHISKRPLSHGRTLRYLVHLRWPGRHVASFPLKTAVFLWCSPSLSCESDPYQVPEFQVWENLPPSGHPPAVFQEVHGGGQWCCLRASVFHRVPHGSSIFSTLLRWPPPLLLFQWHIDASDRLWLVHGPWARL